MTVLDRRAEPRTDRPDPHLTWWHEVLLALSFYLVYSIIRNIFGAGPESKDIAFRHARGVIKVEEWVGAWFEPQLQRWYLGLPGHGFIKGWNIFYGTAGRRRGTAGRRRSRGGPGGATRTWTAARPHGSRQQTRPTREQRASTHEVEAAQLANELITLVLQSTSPYLICFDLEFSGRWHKPTLESHSSHGWIRLSRVHICRAYTPSLLRHPTPA